MNANRDQEAGYRQLVELMDSKIKNIIDHTDDARRFAADTSPPNRNDSVNKPAIETWPYRLGKNQTAPSTGFGASTQPASGFGAATRPGFGGASQPAFGAPSLPNSGTGFGASSGGPAGFGAPSALGSKPSPFGGAASAAPGTGFGAPSALGSKPNPFGGAQQAASGFGAPSAIGAKPSPFGAPQQPAAGGFGAPSQPAFGSSGFGARPAASPFAAAAAQPNNTSPFGSAAQTTGGFGSQQPAAQTNSSPFGGNQQQPAQTAGPAFGAPSAFGAARPSPFAAPAQQQQQQPQPAFNRPNPFGANPPTGPAAQTNSSPFRGTQQQAQPAASGFGASSIGASTRQNGTPTTWKDKGRVVTDEKLDKPGYIVQDASKPNGQGIERIWFLEGPPEISEKLNAMTEAPAAVYEDPAIGPKLKEIYEWTAQHGTFVKDGAIVMPEIPPKREWCTFDF